MLNTSARSQRAIDVERRVACGFNVSPIIVVSAGWRYGTAREVYRRSGSDSVNATLWRGRRLWESMAGLNLSVGQLGWIGWPGRNEQR
jgi:hypothetical protein